MNVVARILSCCDHCLLLLLISHHYHIVVIDDVLVLLRTFLLILCYNCSSSFVVVIWWAAFVAGQCGEWCLVCNLGCWLTWGLGSRWCNVIAVVWSADLTILPLGYQRLARGYAVAQFLWAFESYTVNLTLNLTMNFLLKSSMFVVIIKILMMMLMCTCSCQFSFIVVCIIYIKWDSSCGCFWPSCSRS